MALVVGVELPVRLAADDLAWMDAAACKGLTHLFFAASGERPEHRRPREAKAAAICRTCPVGSDCKEFARVNHEYGFWGGESEDERHNAGYRLNAPIGVVPSRQAG
jgi:WhiB family redox-sensing transcriptional regulator